MAPAHFAHRCVETCHGVWRCGKVRDAEALALALPESVKDHCGDSGIGRQCPSGDRVGPVAGRRGLHKAVVPLGEFLEFEPARIVDADRLPIRSAAAEHDESVLRQGHPVVGEDPTAEGLAGSGMAMSMQAAAIRIRTCSIIR